MAGKKVQNAPRPTQTVEWVSWSRTNGTVMVCIHVPVFETRAAEKKRAKSRWRIAASAPPPSPVTARIYRRGGNERLFATMVSWFPASVRSSPPACR